MTALALTSHSLPAAPRLGFSTFARIVRNWNDRRITRNALAHLDAHLMRDIGLTPNPRDPGVELLRSARVSW